MLANEQTPVFLFTRLTFLAFICRGSLLDSSSHALRGGEADRSLVTRVGLSIRPIPPLPPCQDTIPLGSPMMQFMDGTGRAGALVVLVEYMVERERERGGALTR